MMLDMSPEQWAMAAFAAGVIATEAIRRCPKPYAWLKVKSAWLHKKLDAVVLPEEISDEIKAVYAAAVAALDAWDKALEDDKISYSETVILGTRALALIKAVRKLI